MATLSVRGSSACGQRERQAKTRRELNGFGSSGGIERLCYADPGDRVCSDVVSCNVVKSVSDWTQGIQCRFAQKGLEITSCEQRRPVQHFRGLVGLF